MHDFCISKNLTTSEQLSTDETYISFIVINGSAEVTLKNTETATEVIFKAKNASTDAKHFPFPYPIKIRSGVYVEITGSGDVTVGYYG